MTRDSLISAVEGVLLQGCALLQAAEGEAYARKDNGPHGASIGAHYRHVLDHFLCLLEGIESGEINYDQRRRSPELEGSSEAALLATDELIEKFRLLPTEALHLKCCVTYSVDYGVSDAQAVRSNVAREVMFCVGHAIHHFAILQMLCAARSISVPYEFGIAPSTLKHLETQAAH
jgi:hypothetical protein